MRDHVEQYEANAEAFYRETRFIAPGKDIPAAMGGYDEDELRAKLWRVWLEKQRMADRIAQQDARIRELETDAKRLDWLQSWLDKRNGFDEDSRIEITHIMCGIDKRRGNFASISRLTDIDSREGDDISGFGEGIRAAIDSAMTPEVSNG